MNPYFERDGIVLYHGDCLQVMQELEAESVTLILADLPYGVTACKWDAIIPLDQLWAGYKRLINSTGAVVLTSSQPFTSMLVMSNLDWFKYAWVWQKSKATGFLDARRKPLKEHEDVLVFAKGAIIYNPQTTVGRSHVRNPLGGKQTEVYGHFTRRPTLSNEFCPRSILSFKNAYYVDGEQSHPTQKPVALMDYLVRTYCNAGDMVMDNSMGSGTTGVACVQTGRRFIGIEISEEYCRIAAKRIEAALQQPRLLLDEPERAEQQAMVLEV